MVSTTGLPGPGPRLQDLVDTDAAVEPTVHRDFGFWLEGSTTDDPEVSASMERANAAVVPTVRLSADVGAAYWCRIGEKAHLRWVVPYEEDALLDALARLGAAGTLAPRRGHPVRGVVPGARPAGPGLGPAGRAAGRSVGGAGGRVRRPAGRGARRATGPLTSAERRARDGLRGRQLTLR